MTKFADVRDRLLVALLLEQRKVGFGSYLDPKEVAAQWKVPFQPGQVRLCVDEFKSQGWLKCTNSIGGGPDGGIHCVLTAKGVEQAESLEPSIANYEIDLLGADPEPIFNASVSLSSSSPTLVVERPATPPSKQLERLRVEYVSAQIWKAIHERYAIAPDTRVRLTKSELNKLWHELNPSDAMNYVPDTDFDAALTLLAKHLDFQTVDRPHAERFYEFHMGVTMSTLFGEEEGLFKLLNEAGSLSSSWINTTVRSVYLTKPDRTGSTEPHQQTPIPASDRYVSIHDNQTEFDALRVSLDRIRDEFARDHNRGVYRGNLPVLRLRSEIDATYAQIQVGFIRTEQLTECLRPALLEAAVYCSAYDGLMHLIADAIKMLEAVMVAIGLR